MKKALKILPLALIMLSAVSCQPTSSESSSNSEAPASSSQASSTTPSSTTPTSSTTPSSSSEVSSSEASSSDTTSVIPSESSSQSSPEAKVVTQKLDIASLGAHSKGTATGDWEENDGFFKFFNMSAEAGKRIKTDATSDVEAKKAVIQFTTTGAGKLSLTAKSGSTGTVKKLFVAKLTSSAIGEGATFNYIHDKVFTDAYSDAEFDIYEAGTYLILSSANTSISKLEVTYKEGTTSTMPAYTPTLVDATRLSLLDIRPGVYTEVAVSANYTINGEVTYKGDRTISGTNATIKKFNDCLSASAGTVAVKFTAPSTGTVSIWAIENEKTGTVKLGYKESTAAKYTYSETYLKSEAVKDASKTPEAITFSVDEGKSYDITCDTGSMSIFLMEFTAL